MRRTQTCTHHRASEWALKSVMPQARWAGTQSKLRGEDAGFRDSKKYKLKIYELKAIYGFLSICYQWFSEADREQPRILTRLGCARWNACFIINLSLRMRQLTWPFAGLHERTIRPGINSDGEESNKKKVSLRNPFKRRETSSHRSTIHKLVNKI